MYDVKFDPCLDGDVVSMGMEDGSNSGATSSASSAGPSRMDGAVGSMSESASSFPVVHSSFGCIAVDKSAMTVVETISSLELYIYAQGRCSVHNCCGTFGIRFWMAAFCVLCPVQDGCHFEPDV